MQINALLTQFHQRITLANNEVNHKLDIKLNQLIYMLVRKNNFTTYSFIRLPRQVT